MIMKKNFLTIVTNAKISDVEGKGMCRDAEYVDCLKHYIDWRLRHSK